MSSHYEAPIRKPLVIGDKSYHDITEDIARPIETPPNKDWWIAFGISMAAFMWGVGCIIYTIGTGIGTLTPTIPMLVFVVKCLEISPSEV